MKETVSKTACDTYDAIIIGAGIGGLVCGCYLAKAGMKVLICEQHSKPGGYCASFKRRGVTFDAAAHSLGGYRYGNIGKIFDDLGISETLNIRKIDPSDIIITPDYRISFWTDLNRTIEDFQKAFPDESGNIRNFFNFLVNPESGFFLGSRSKSFKDLLDMSFRNERLKSVISFPLFGNGGLPHYEMSAFIGAKIFKEFLLDGGYYPEDGIGALPDSLAGKFKQFGGELRLSCPVRKIRVNNGDAVGIRLEEGEFVPSRYVVANCDARQIFFRLLDRNESNKEVRIKTRKMIPSLSGFMVYLIVGKELERNMEQCGSNLWIMHHYDLKKAYCSAKNGRYGSTGGFVLHIYPDKRRIFAFMNAPFKNRTFWKDNKDKIADHFIGMIEQAAVPGLSKHILFREAATPFTLYRYTLNYKGAAFGWAAMPSQLADPDFRKPSFLRNLYLAGHWTTHGLGIPGVAYTGYDVATAILRRKDS